MNRWVGGVMIDGSRRKMDCHAQTYRQTRTHMNQQQSGVIEQKHKRCRNEGEAQPGHDRYACNTIETHSIVVTNKYLDEEN